MVKFIAEKGRVYKVLADDGNVLWVIDYENPCAPRVVRQDDNEPFETVPVPDDYIQERNVSQALFDTASKRYDILRPMISNNLYIADSNERHKTVAKIAADAGISEKTLQRWYYSYLAYGESGLYPAPKIKKDKALPPEHEKKIASALSKYYYSPKKRSLRTTYEMMLLKYYRNEHRKICQGSDQ